MEAVNGSFVCHQKEIENEILHTKIIYDNDNKK